MLFTFSVLHITTVEAVCDGKQDGSRTGEKEPNAIRPGNVWEKESCSRSPKQTTWDESRCLVAVPSSFQSLKRSRERGLFRKTAAETPTQEIFCTLVSCATQSPLYEICSIVNVSLVDATRTRTHWARFFFFRFAFGGILHRISQTSSAA